MADNPSQPQPARQASDSSADSAPARLIAASTVSILLGLLVWVAPLRLVPDPPTPLPWASILLWAAFSFGLHAGLTFSLQRTLASALPKAARPVTCRIAFLSSITLGFIRTLAYVRRSPGWQVALIPAMVSLGALAGGFILTFIDKGLVEHNYPPSEEIKAWVERKHALLLTENVPEARTKRIFDAGLALVGLLVTAPFCAIISMLIWLEDPGPVLFIKNSVGRGGENFHQYKFRTMVHGAEFETGPILAQKNDARVLLLGRVLRKTGLDELPQLFNILRGDMSFVGPRPQRTVLVQSYLETMPEFAQRHSIRPGLTGLAQLVGNYRSTPRQKLRFDRIYARHASLGYDLKLLLLTFTLVFWFRWRKDWDGRIPRKWLRLGA